MKDQSQKLTNLSFNSKQSSSLKKLKSTKREDERERKESNSKSKRKRRKKRNYIRR